MYVWADSFEQLLEETIEELEFLFEQYAPMPDEDLAAGAIQLKRNLNALVMKREEI